jgi:hypothetical protein
MIKVSWSAIRARILLLKTDAAGERPASGKCALEPYCVQAWSAALSRLPHRRLRCQEGLLFCSIRVALRLCRHDGLRGRISQYGCCSRRLSSWGTRIYGSRSIPWLFHDLGARVPTRRRMRPIGLRSIADWRRKMIGFPVPGSWRGFNSLFSCFNSLFRSVGNLLTK